ncbi:MAG: aldehyde dehydrogenase family protein, partial [Alphaproteobacteria bacterium]|nr:aldehyde dehydrogenase family protein [Alphaproteobacteria bacterium]
MGASRPLQSVNPATGETIAEYQPHDEAYANAAIERAHACFLRWRGQPFAERAQLMRKAAQLLRERKAALARLITDEMGKLLKDGAAEIEKCALCCEHFAAHGGVILADEQI